MNLARLVNCPLNAAFWTPSVFIDGHSFSLPPWSGLAGKAGRKGERRKDPLDWPSLARRDMSHRTAWKP